MKATGPGLRPAPAIFMGGAMSKKLGRPPRISRETVLDAAVEIASADPNGAVSIGAIARHIKVTPMAIYTYFASKDALMQALSQRLLEGFATDHPDGLEPVEALRAWSHAIRRHFLANPSLIRMLAWDGGHNSVAWLNSSEPMLAALGGLGLDDATFAQAVLWTWSTVLGAIQFEIHYRQFEPRLREEEAGQLVEPVRTDMAKIGVFQKQDGYLDRYFEFQIDRLVDALRQLSAKFAAADQKA